MNARRRAAALLEVLGVYLAGQLVTGQLILSLLLAALGSGVVFAWTRSLLPSVLAHAISNVPMTRSGRE
jgi:membrane protease YdiL (CAAX protease family)